MSSQAPEVPHHELELTYSRSSGPGGQHANKAATKVTLRWDVAHSPSLSEAVRQRFMHTYGPRLTDDGVLVMSCQAHRSRQANIDDCIARLGDMLSAVARPPKKRRKTRPSRASKLRRLEAKRRQKEKKRRRRRPRIDD